MLKRIAARLRRILSAFGDLFNSKNKNKLNEMKTLAESQQGQNAALQAQNTELQARFDGMAAALQAQLDTTKAQFDTLQIQLGDMTAAIQAQFETTKTQFGTLQIQLGDMQGLVASVKNQASKFQAQNNVMLWMLEPSPKPVRLIQESFWEAYPKAQGDMQLIQRCNLWLMKELKAICDANGLLFWLHGGSLIGAIVHKGFIPWDDDVDLGMTRNDLEKLIAIVDKSEKYQIYQYYHEGGDFSRAYQFKLRDSDVPNFVDIFVFDFCNCDTPRQRFDFRIYFSEVQRSMSSAFKNLEKPLHVEDVGMIRFGPFSEEDKKIADRIIDEHLDKMGNYREGNCIYYSLENHPYGYPIFPVDEIFPTQKLLFEGEYFDAPKNVDLFLTPYGDYWTIPGDIGKRTPHYYWYEDKIAEIAAYMDSL